MRIVELRQLRYFVAVVEEGGFSRAAERLHISQPPLSTQIKGLEDEVGVRLFERSNRGVSVTAAGAVFYEEVVAVLARLEHARNKTLQVGRGDVGSLSVGFVSIADYGILPPALKSFRAQFPLVEVHLHELTTDAQIRELRAATLDLGMSFDIFNVGIEDVRRKVWTLDRLTFTGAAILLRKDAAFRGTSFTIPGEGSANIQRLS